MDREFFFRLCRRRSSLFENSSKEKKKKGKPNSCVSCSFSVHSFSVFRILASTTMAGEQRYSPLLACKVRHVGGAGTPSPLLFRRLLLALLAVACFSAGWACRGSGSGSGGGGVGADNDVVAPDAFLSSASSPPSLPRSFASTSSSPPFEAARPTDTLVVYIFANSGE